MTRERNLSLRTLKKHLPLRNLKKTLSLGTLKGTVSPTILKRNPSLRTLKRTLKTLRSFKILDDFCATKKLFLAFWWCYMIEWDVFTLKYLYILEEYWKYRKDHSGYVSWFWLLLQLFSNKENCTKKSSRNISEQKMPWSLLGQFRKVFVKILKVKSLTALSVAPTN